MPVRSSQSRTSAKAPKATRYHLRPMYVHRTGAGHVLAVVSSLASQLTAGIVAEGWA